MAMNAAPVNLDALDSQSPGRHFILHPGDVAIGFQGDSFETLLGSCVSVILTDPRRTVGAMCHIVHSTLPQHTLRGDTSYAHWAMEAMFAQLRASAIAPELCHAYLYGGGNMFPQVFSPRHVGALNAEWARQFLAAHNIPVLAESVGDNYYRKLWWAVGPLAPQVKAVSSVASPL